MEKQVSNWLTISGKPQPKREQFPKREDFTLWFELMLEEIVETVDSADYETILKCQEIMKRKVKTLVKPQEGKQADIVEFIDGICDVPVVHSNLIHFAGMVDSFEGYMDEVMLSNFSKFCETEEIAKESVEKYKDGTHPFGKGKKINASYRNNGDIFIIFDSSNGKLLKSVNFVEPNI